MLLSSGRPGWHNSPDLLDLKVKLKPKLNFTHALRQRINLPESTAVYHRISRAKIRMVQGVKRFQAEFHAHTFAYAGHGKFLEKRHVHHFRSRLAYCTISPRSIAQGVW